MLSQCRWNTIFKLQYRNTVMQLQFWGIFFFFWPGHMSYGILVPQPGIESRSPAVEVWSSNHWTTREFCFVVACSFGFCSYVSSKLLLAWSFSPLHHNIFEFYHHWNLQTQIPAFHSLNKIHSCNFQTSVAYHYISGFWCHFPFLSICCRAIGFILLPRILQVPFCLRAFALATTTSCCSYCCC